MFGFEKQTDFLDLSLIMKKKILMISYRFPWPENKGGYNLRVLNFAKILKEEYDVSLLTLIENKKEEENIECLKKENIFEEIIYFYHPQFQEYKNALQGVFSKLPLQVAYYFSKEIKDYLFKNYHHYDLLYFNTLRTAIYLYQLQGVANNIPPSVIDLIDSIALNYSDAQKWNKNLLWRLIYQIEIPRLKRFEKKIINDNNFKKVFISSEFDKKYLVQGLKKVEDEELKVVTMPNGVKEELFSFSSSPYAQEENWISFLGKMDTQPNQDAVVFFAKEVFPKIYSDPRFSDLCLYIVGISPTRKIKKLEKMKNVRVTGYLKDPYEILSKSKIVVAPLRFGAGIQNKVLEAMAMEKTVVTSSIGARGINKGVPGKHFEVIESFDPEMWKKKIIALLLNPQKREMIGKEARRLLINENYRWEKVGEKILKEIRDVYLDYEQGNKK